MSLVPSETAPLESSSNERRVAIAIVLIALTVGAVSFYVLYTQLIASNSFVSGTEFQAASKAVDSLTVACAMVQTMPLNLATNSSTMLVTVGIQNPSNLSINATWTINLDYTDAYVYLSSIQSFQIPAHDTAHPTFLFRVLDYQTTALQYAVNRSFQSSINATFQVSGIHGVYTIARNSTYDSKTGSTSGSLGAVSNNTVPSCP